MIFVGLVDWLRPYAQYLYDVAAYNQLQPRVTSVRRTREQQAALYARFLRGQSDLPAAPPGTSDHELGLAFDMVVAGNYRGPEQRAVGEFWRAMGGAWSERDPVHFFVRVA